MASCITPTILQLPGYMTPVPVPCGKCHLCRLRKLSFLVELCEHEYNYHLRNGRHSSFITLTYSDFFLPLCGPCKRGFQLFHKRFRKICPIKGYKFIACGEYGEKTNRAHIHMVAFGLPPSDEIHTLLDMCWNRGIVDIGFLKPGGIKYVVDYLMYHSGKLDSPQNKEFLQSGRIPPWFIKSKRIGYDWLLSIRDEYLENGYFLSNGTKRALPRYYADLLGVTTDYTQFPPSTYTENYFRAKSAQTSSRAKLKPFEDLEYNQLDKEFLDGFIPLRRP